MKNQPKTIFLNIGAAEPDEISDFKDCQGVTWSEAKIYPQDIEYAHVATDKPGEVMSAEEIIKPWLSSHGHYISEDDAIGAMEEYASIKSGDWKQRAEKAEQQVSDLETALIITINSRTTQKKKANELEQQVKSLRESFKSYVEKTGLSNSDKNLVKGVFCGWMIERTKP